jgi:hypothetical protein
MRFYEAKSTKLGNPMEKILLKKSSVEDTLNEVIQSLEQASNGLVASWQNGKAITTEGLTSEQIQSLHMQLESSRFLLSLCAQQHQREILNAFCAATHCVGITPSKPIDLRLALVNFLDQQGIIKIGELDSLVARQ